MRKWVSLLICLLLLVSAAQAEVFTNGTPPEDWASRPLLRITVFSTGEGDAMLVEAGGEYMMVDGGPQKWGEPLLHALQDRGLTHPKYFFNTHPHDDHVKGLCYLMEHGVTADEFVSIFRKDFDRGLQKIAMRTCRRADVPFRRLADGDVLTVGDASLTVRRRKDAWDLNAMSPLVRVTYKDASALLCSDIDGLTQRFFLENLDADFLKADVMKVPHHGITAVVSPFMDAVDPRAMIITNKNNDKISKVLYQAEMRAIPAFITGDGTVVLETDGTDWYISQLAGEF